LIFSLRRFVVLGVKGKEAQAQLKKYSCGDGKN
jgi:hypothetical protein